MAHGRPESGPAPERRRKLPVLIVEDDENIAYVLNYMLEQADYKPVVLRDGRAAADIIERLGPPALVLLDVKLPYIDGLRLIAMMREKETWRRVPVLILSSVSDDRGIQRAMEAGATDYLVKPFETAALLKRVRHLTAQAG